MRAMIYLLMESLVWKSRFDLLKLIIIENYVDKTKEKI